MTARRAVRDAAGNSPSRGDLAPLDRGLVVLSAVVIGGAAMTVLDATAVNVAVPTLARDLHAPVGAVQWVLTGYLLTLALVVPFAAWADERRSAGRLDAVGLVLASVGLTGLIYGLSEAATYGAFTDPHVWTTMAVGALVIAAFTARSLRLGRRALIDLRLFADRCFVAASAGLFLLGMALFGALLLLPFYYQQVRGQGALGAGMLLVPQGAGVAVVLRAAGRLTDRRGPRAAVLPGITLMALGTLPFTRVGTHPAEAMLEAALVVRGLGMGLVMTPITAAAYITLPRDALPAASSATTVIRQIGGSVGTALLAVAIASQDARGPARLAVAFGHAFWLALTVTLVMLVPALFLPARPASRLAR